MEKELTKKEEVGYGIMFATIPIAFVILIMFLWSPTFFFLGKWNGIWHEKEPDELIQTLTYLKYENYLKISQLCSQKIQDYYGLLETQVYFYASSTSDNKDVADCYGLKLNSFGEVKIKE